MAEPTNYGRTREAEAPKSAAPVGGTGVMLTNPTHELRAGDICPKCGVAKLDYDGLLNLSCPACGYAIGGCFT